MTGDAEAMLLGEFVAQRLQFFVLKFKELVALGTVKVVVLGIAIVVLIDRAAIEYEFSQQACIDELPERAIHRWAADMAGLPARRKLFHELVSVEMLMAGEDMIDESQSLLRHAHAAALQIFDETFAWREGDGDAAKGALFIHKWAA